MGDAFSNWVNKGIDTARDLSHRLQSESKIHQPAKPIEHKQAQQIHEQQLQVDRVELTDRGHLPKARVSKTTLEFGNGNKGESRQKGGDKQNSHSDSKKAPNEKHNSSSEKHNTPSEKHNAPAEKHNAPAEKHNAPAEKHNATGSREGHTGRPAPHANESVAGRSPVLEAKGPAVPARNYLSPDDFLKQMQKFGVYDKAPQAAAAKAHSPYVELRNVPDHVRQGGHKAEAGSAQQQRNSEGHKAEQKGPKAENKPDTHKKPEPQTKPTEQGKAEGSRKPEGPRNEGPRKPEAQGKPEGHTSESKPGRTSTSQTEPVAPKSEVGSLRSAGGKLVGGGLGLLGVVGGYYETKQGIEQLRHGNKAEGLLNTTAGVSDMSSGTASILYTMGKTTLGGAAAKLGGAGAIFSGTAETIQGIRNNDTEQKVEGGIKVTLGAGMFVAGRTSPLSAAALGGWSGGRFIGQHAGWGGENIDTKVTRVADNAINKEANAELNAIKKNEQALFEKSQGVIGSELGRMEANGTTRREVSDAVMGLRGQVEAARERGDDTEAMKAEIRRLTEVRGQLSR